MEFVWGIFLRFTKYVLRYNTRRTLITPTFYFLNENRDKNANAGTLKSILFLDFLRSNDTKIVCVTVQSRIYSNTINTITPSSCATLQTSTLVFALKRATIKIPSSHKLLLSFIWLKAFLFDTIFHAHNVSYQFTFITFTLSDVTFMWNF